MKRFCIIDTFGLLFRAYYALPDMKTQKGLPSGAIFGMANFLIQLLGTWKPDNLLAVIDMGKPTFRHDAYEHYKANRVEAPDDFKVQIDHALKVLKAFGIPIVGLEGYEADDLAGTIAKYVSQHQKNTEVICFTGDQDYFQLVNDKVHVLTPQIGFSKAKLYTPEAVQEKLGITPDQVVDFKGLKGDASDNVPGVPGIGDKTAAKLLQQYRTIEGVYEHIDELKGKLKENLGKYKDQAFMSRDLVRLHTDIPFDKHLIQESKVHEFNMKEIEKTLIEYDCYSTLQRFKKLEETKSTKITKNPTPVETPKQQSLF